MFLKAFNSALSFALKWAVVLMLSMTPLLLTATTFVGWSLVVYLMFALVAGSWVTGAFALFFIPGFLFFLGMKFVHSVQAEAALIRRVGRDKALWWDVSLDGPAGHPSKGAIRMVVTKGWDVTRSFAVDAGVPGDALTEDIPGFVTSTGSVWWSHIILGLANFQSTFFIGWASFAVWLWMLWFCLKRVTSTFLRTVFWCYFLILVISSVPSGFFLPLFTAFIRSIVALGQRDIDGRNLFLKWLGWRVTSLLVVFAGQMTALNSEFERHYSSRIAGESRSLGAHFRAFTISAVSFLDDISLPSFVRNRMTAAPGWEDIKKSTEMMKDLGWPINVEVTAPDPAVARLGFSEWLIGGSDFATGIRQLRANVDADLEAMRPALVHYKRTETYRNIDNELASTSRYFVNREMISDTDALDDVWEVLKPIFANSRLTPFNYIIKMWEKKYALGSFMRSIRNSRSKYKRSDFISDIGGFAPFKRLWRSTFYWGSMIYPVAHVSVKDESLPEKKWANDVVRTIVGSPISQYIISTIWNYGPNHRFSFDETPIKVGMPLNGYHMTDLFKRHARCQVHGEGDFTAFDSSLSGDVVRVIAAIRKRGFDKHKDYNRICDLIDVNYDQVQRQSLNPTSTGGIYAKGTGLTTGHSSTSMDNSIATVTFYLMAWKELTGLSAREFLHFNELSCYGDDHIISMLQFRPAAWTFKNISKVMSQWGVKNNIQGGKLEDLSFLSKRGRRATNGDIASLASLGINDVRFVVWHDKLKLLGKLTAQVKTANPTYKAKRLLSFLTLAAHHEDIYNGIVKILQGSSTMKMILKHNKMKIPSYAQVMKDWYSPSRQERPWAGLADELPDFENTGAFTRIGSVTVMDAIFGTLSLVPDLVNPAIFNYGYSRALQSLLMRHLLWAVDFVSTTNNSTSVSHIQALLRRTPYRVLEAVDMPIGTSQSSRSEQLVRHWLYLLYVKTRPSTKLFAWLGFVGVKVANIQFVLNGKVFQEGKATDFTIDLVLVLAILNFVQVPPWFGWIMPLTLPDIGLGIDLLTHWLLVGLWTRVPPNFQPVNVAIKQMDFSQGPLLVEAPTGVGKSTSMVSFLHNEWGSKYRHIIVIQPRSLLVSGVSAYMKTAYGLKAAVGTFGGDFDSNAKVWYATPQFMVAHLQELVHDNLFVLDEAHLEEPFYKFFKRVLIGKRLHTLLVTATPGADLVSKSYRHVQLSMASVFSKKDHIVNVPAHALGDLPGDHDKVRHFVKEVMSRVHTLAPSDKALVYLPTVHLVRECVDKCKMPAVGLSSEHPIPSKWDATVYFATNVADVGITIPDLTHVLTSNFSHYVNGALLALTPAGIHQRLGRTGRTCNGITYLWAYPGLQSPPAIGGPMTAADWKELLSSGVPGDVAFSLDASRTFEALGFDYDALSIERKSRLQGSAHVFLANFAPIVSAQVAASNLGKVGFGPPVHLAAGSAGEVDPDSSQPASVVDVNSVDVVASLLLGLDNGEESPLLGTAAHSMWKTTESYFTTESLYGMLHKGWQAFGSVPFADLTRSGLLAGMESLQASFQMSSDMLDIGRILADPDFD